MSKRDILGVKDGQKAKCPEVQMARGPDGQKSKWQEVLMAEVHIARSPDGLMAGSPDGQKA